MTYTFTREQLQCVIQTAIDGYDEYRTIYDCKSEQAALAAASDIFDALTVEREMFMAGEDEPNRMQLFIDSEAHQAHEKAKATNND